LPGWINSIAFFLINSTSREQPKSLRQHVWHLWSNVSHQFCQMRGLEVDFNQLNVSRIGLRSAINVKPAAWTLLDESDNVHLRYSYIVANHQQKNQNYMKYAEVSYSD
jgi:hypothetical protein